MDRYVSDPLPVPDLTEEISSAEIVFAGVDHRNDSYVAHVYLGNPDVTYEAEPDPAKGYVGSFTVFGHAGCFGDEGHCDPSLGYRDEFDLRPPHPMTPITKTVVVGEDALARLEGDEVVVTVVAADENEEEGKLSDAMQFEEIRLLLYQD